MNNYHHSNHCGARILAAAFTLGLIGLSGQTLAQSQVIDSTSTGDKVHMTIRPLRVQSELDTITAHINELNSSVGSLHAVATSGDYSDLENTPTSVTSFTDVSSAGSGEIITSAERTKLTGIASNAEVNVNADWTATTGDAQILNKPTLATVATSGAYSDLSGTPTSVTDFTDVSNAGSGQIITGAERTKLTGIASNAEVNVNADWTATTGDAQILNKPTSVTTFSDVTSAGSGSIITTAERTAFVALMNVVDSLNCTWLKYAGEMYQLVRIGQDCWFADNLRADHFSDGTPITDNLTGAGWAGATAPATTVHDYSGPDEEENRRNYGRLYNGYTVTSTSPICPGGWRLPSDADWMSLEQSLGMDAADAANSGERGTDEGETLKSSPTDYLDWDGTNSVGFTAVPSGGITTAGAEVNKDTKGYWWSSTVNTDNGKIWWRSLDTGISTIGRSDAQNTAGASIRCIRGAAPL